VRTPPFFRAIDVIHTYGIYMLDKWMHRYECVYLPTSMNTLPMRACSTSAVDVCVHLRAHAHERVCVWSPAHLRRTVRALSVGEDRLRFGLQAFAVASAFNANIGAWNTASVSNMVSVRAAFGRRLTTGRARPVFDAARPLCAAAPPMRAHRCPQA
jgi:hypothetical protein